MQNLILKQFRPPPHQIKSCRCKKRGPSFLAGSKVAEICLFVTEGGGAVCLDAVIPTWNWQINSLSAPQYNMSSSQPKLRIGKGRPLVAACLRTLGHFQSSNSQSNWVLVCFRILSDVFFKVFESSLKVAGTASSQIDFSSLTRDIIRFCNLWN